MIEAEALESLESESEEEPVAETEEETEIESEVEEEPATDEEIIEETEEYDAIVLVPVDDFPPVNEEVSVSEEDEVEVVDETPAVEEVSEEPVVEIQPSVVEPVVIIPSTKTQDDFEKYTLNSLSDLVSGKYYIQIAVLRDKANIQDIINKYGKHYPIVLVPTASGSAKQVMVGPLSVDEYGTVLARFKANGFKDAFLRKIK